MKLVIPIFCFLLCLSIVHPGGWGMILGRNRWAGMKHTSSTGRFLRTHLTKVKLLKTTLTSTISTLGLLGSLALFKKIEKPIDPSNTDSLSIVHSMISQINNQIKNQNSTSNFSDKNTISNDRGCHNMVILELSLWHPHTNAQGIYKQLLFSSYPVFCSKNPRSKWKNYLRFHTVEVKNYLFIEANNICFLFIK